MKKKAATCASVWEALSPSSSAVVTTPQITALFDNRPIIVTPRLQFSLSDPTFSFPISVIRALNCGDNFGLSGLLRQHMGPNCSLGIYCLNSILTPRTFLRFFALMNDIHPDRVINITGLNVSNCQITVSTDVKFSDCRLLYQCVAPPVDDPVLMTLFVGKRANQLKRRMCIPGQSEEERSHLTAMIESDCDLLVTARIQFHVTIDEFTKKVKGLYLTGGITSAGIAPASLLDGQY